MMASAMTALDDSAGVTEADRHGLDHATLESSGRQLTRGAGRELNFQGIEAPELIGQCALNWSRSRELSAEERAFAPPVNGASLAQPPDPAQG